MRRRPMGTSDVPDEERGAFGPQPLAGLQVVDLSRVLAAPLCTMILGDLGADVIKVERPGAGDDTRSWGPPFVDGEAAYFLSLNRNKRSVAVDLSAEEGAATVRALIGGADVVIENFRSGVMESFDLGLDALREEHPRLVTCTLTAFGEDPAETRPGYDIIMQALSGLMSVTGEPDGEPVKVGVALLDVIAGLYAAIGILAALSERDRTGRGRHVSVSLFDAAAAAMVNQAANYLMGGVVPTGMGTAHPNIVPYQAFRAADRPFILAAGNDRLFGRTCEIIGRPELSDDPRFATNEARVRERETLVPLLQALFATETAEHWLSRLEDAGVPCAPVRSLDEVFTSAEGRAAVQQIAGLDLVADPIKVDGKRLQPRLRPPHLGEHTEDILGSQEDG
jgi:crotonobetainyl-CoA:carnitine CoA-transferase CaiB-like acyl-CoA transferase